MSSAQKKSDVLLPALRFGVVQGGRGVAASAVTPVVTAEPATKLSHRGLSLVTNASAKAAQANSKVDSFAQARRIVAQVEWEIEQQAARERSQRLRGWPTGFARTAIIAPIRMPVASSLKGFARIRRFFGF